MKNIQSFWVVFVLKERICRLCSALRIIFLAQMLQDTIERSPLSVHCEATFRHGTLSVVVQKVVLRVVYGQDVSRVFATQRTDKKCIVIMSCQNMVTRFSSLVEPPLRTNL
jgi:hypothetical protein